MHWTMAVISGLVAWALLSSPWRKGSLVLGASWILAQIVYWRTGVSVPVSFYIPADLLVFWAVFMLRTTWLDWIILGAFPAQWWAYFNTEGAQQWWVLWALACVQMLAAGPWKQTMRGLHSFSHGPCRVRQEA